MPSIMPTLAVLCPGVNCQPKPGLATAATVDDVQWDPPLPEGFVPPTQGEVDAEIARQAAAAVRITVPAYYLKDHAMVEKVEWQGEERALYDLIDAWARTVGGRALLAWESAPNFDHDRDFVRGFAAAHELSDEYVKGVFTRARARIGNV